MTARPEKSKDHQETNWWPRRICTSSPQSEPSDLSDNADRRCQPQPGSWRRMRRMREGSQRRKGQLRREETHKGKEGRGKSFTAGKEQMTFERVTEYRKWARRLKGLGGKSWLWKRPLISFPSLKCFLHKAQTTKTLRESCIYGLKTKERSFQSCIDKFSSWSLKFDGTSICFHPSSMAQSFVSTPIRKTRHEVKTSLVQTSSLKSHIYSTFPAHCNATQNLIQHAAS